MSDCNCCIDITGEGQSCLVVRRGTTPCHYFTFPSPLDTYSYILITYAQGRKIVFEKRKEDLTQKEDDDKTGWFRLTQEETLRFKANNDVQLQVRALTVENEALASRIFDFAVESVLNDGVIGE